MDIRLALMCGIDIPIPEIQVTIHQPSIKEIAYIGEQEFFIGLQTISINKNMISQDNSILENTTNFQIFMTIMKEQETKDKKESVLSFFQLIFPNYQVILTPASMILSKDDVRSIIDATNFEILQNYIKEIFCINSGPASQTTFNPADEKARKIAEKLMRGRQRVAEQNGEIKGSVLGRYASILTIGLNAMSLSEVINLTMYQLYDLMERYSLHLKWDLDIRAKLAGSTSESKTEDWMKNIH